MAETLTLKQIRELILGDAGLIMDALSAVFVDSNTYTIDKLADKSPDPYRMRDSFLYKPSNDTTAAYTNAVTVNGAHTASVTILDYTSAGDDVTAGDVIMVDSSEKMLVELVDAANNKLTVVRGFNGTTAAAYTGGETVEQAAGPEFRRVTNFNYPTSNNVDLSRGFTFNEDFVGQIIFLIDPDDADKSINAALENPQVRTIERTPITFINNTNEYALPTGIHSKTQILGVYLRDSSTSDVIEQSAPAWKIIEDNNAATLHFIVIPTFSANVNFIVVWRKFFSPLTYDAETTTCPKELIVPQAEFELFKKIFKQHGDTARRMFAQDMALAEKRVQEYVAAVISPAETREYNINEPIYVPDVLPKSYSW